MGGARQSKLPIASSKVKLRAVRWCSSVNDVRKISQLSHSTHEGFIGGQIFRSHCDVRGGASFQASCACTHCVLCCMRPRNKAMAAHYVDDRGVVGGVPPS